MPSDVVTIWNQKIGEGTFRVVSICQIKTLDSFCAVKKGKHFCPFNAILEVRVLQSLAVCEFCPCVFGAFDEKLVLEWITC